MEFVDLQAFLHAAMLGGVGATARASYYGDVSQPDSTVAGDTHSG